MKNNQKELSILLKEIIATNCVLSIIQFGSSIRHKTDSDIDLAIILKKGVFNNFFGKFSNRSLKEFDISAIKAEEIENLKKFKFGNHGLHFAESLRIGKVLYGTNPFLKIRPNRTEIEQSITNRLYDYIYDVRKAIFSKRINSNISKRWPKFLRLCLYLLNSNLKYPDVLDLNTKKINKILKQNKISLPKNLLLAHEVLWEKVLKKEKII